MRPAGVNTKLSEYEIAEVREVYKGLRSYAATGRALNISAGLVSQIVRGIGFYYRGGKK